MRIEREGSSYHLFADDDTYVGTVGAVPGETPDSDELLARLGVRWTPFDYDFAVMGGALGTYELSRTIPKGARVLGGWYKGETTAISADDSGTMSLGVVAAGDLKAATAISSGTTWDAASAVDLLLSTLDPVTLTADAPVIGVIGTQAWTAGKFHGAVAWTFELARPKQFTAA